MKTRRSMAWMSLGALLAFTGCSKLDAHAAAQPTQAPPAQVDLVKRGEYLVTVSACHDCHSPKIMTEHGPEPDPARLMSGHPAGDPMPPIESAGRQWISFGMDLTSAVGPWGVSFSANLTPHATGIGAWDFERFETAIRKGKSKGTEGGRDLLPPMPWTMYRNFTDADLFAIFTYLKSLPAVNNAVPSPIPPS